MSSDSDVSYEFGGFILNPKMRVLTHFGQPVDLPGKCFDLLAYLVLNPNTVFENRHLINGVWESAAIHERNVSNSIARIRKALGCDWRRPIFVQTVNRGKGYRFIAPVTVISAKFDDKPRASVTPAELENPETTTSQYKIASHIFVPVYLGPDYQRRLPAPLKVSHWITYKELPIEGGRLCILPSGIGVWHINSVNSFPLLTTIAAWRKETYERIFQGKHRLSICTTELLKRHPITDRSIFKPVVGKLGYAYSAMIVHEPRWKDPEKGRNTLEMLACTKPLEPKSNSKQEHDRLLRLERQFLERGFKAADTREFGLTGEDLGFATWEGLSFYQLSLNDETNINNITEFQIALHSVWWLSKCLADVWLSNPAAAQEQLKKYLPELKRQYLIVKNIGAKESTSQRTMTEAVLSVNRLQQIVEETFELLE
jgi:DNA-binding winged helix-turn-helix (wHTH) protein